VHLPSDETGAVAYRDMMETYNFVWLNKLPTREGAYRDSCIDHIHSNNMNFGYNIVNVPFPSLDHNLLIVKTEFPATITGSKKCSIEQCSFVSMKKCKEKFAINMFTVDSLNVNEEAKRFEDYIEGIVEESKTCKLMKKHNVDKPWITHEYVECCKLKNKLYGTIMKKRKKKQVCLVLEREYRITKNKAVNLSIKLKKNIWIIFVITLVISLNLFGRGSMHSSITFRERCLSLCSILKPITFVTRNRKKWLTVSIVFLKKLVNPRSWWPQSHM